MTRYEVENLIFILIDAYEECRGKQALGAGYILAVMEALRK